MRRFAFEEFADRVFNDVFDDVRWRVIDAARFADFGLLLDLGAVAGREADALPRNCSYTWPRMSAGRAANS